MATGDKAQTNFQNFWEKIKGRPLARTERFECAFRFPTMMREDIIALRESMPDDHGSVEWVSPEGEATIMCEEVQIPGMVLQNKEIPIGTWNFMRNSNVNFLGNEINITFLTDHDWYLRHIFELWIDHCVGSTSKEVAFPDDQHGEVTIKMLDLNGVERTSWKLYEVTPKVLNLVPLAHGGVSIARTTLIISSTYWTSKAINVSMAGERNL